MEKIKDAARQSGLFIVTDSDLDYNQPTVQIEIDRSKANELGITCRRSADTLALLVGQNYVKPLQPQRPLVRVNSRRCPAVSGSPPISVTQVLRQFGPRGSRCRCPNLGQGQADHPRPMRLDPLQPAQLGDVSGGADAG